MKDKLTEEAESWINQRYNPWGVPSYLVHSVELIIRLLLDIRDKLDVIDSRSKTCP